VTTNPHLRTLPLRIKYVGPVIYGPVGWIYRLAAGLGISKSTLYEYMNGKRCRDLDAELLALIDRERRATVARRVALRDLRDDVAAAAKKSKKVRDAA
jgi:hypothetical protein